MVMTRNKMITTITKPRKQLKKKKKKKLIKSKAARP